MRGGYGGIEDFAQERASVGHGFTGFELETWNAGYPSDSGKRKPPQGAAGFLARARKGSQSDGKASAPDVSADDVAEQLPPLALEALQLQLADRGKIGRAGVDHHAGQKNFGAEILQVGCLFHDVLAGEIVTALLQHLYQGLANAVSDDDRTVELVAFRKILFEEGEELLHAGIVGPLRIGNVLQIRG